MLQKIINVIEMVGCLLIVGAFAIWNGPYWKESNMLWWAAIICLAPVIAWKAWPQPFLKQCIIALAFCALLVIGKWWFGKKNIRVNIPYLPEITISRN